MAEDAEEGEVLCDCIIIHRSKLLCLCLSDPFEILIHTGLLHPVIHLLSIGSVMKGYTKNWNMIFFFYLSEQSK